MPWVMLPVPEDRVLEVMQFVVRSLRPATSSWDKESVAKVWSEVDVPGRSMLALLAHAALVGEDAEAEFLR